MCFCSFSTFFSISIGTFPCKRYQFYPMTTEKKISKNSIVTEKKFSKNSIVTGKKFKKNHSSYLRLLIPFKYFVMGAKNSTNNPKRYNNTQYSEFSVRAIPNDVSTIEFCYFPPRSIFGSLNFFLFEMLKITFTSLHFIRYHGTRCTRRSGGTQPSLKFVQESPALNHNVSSIDYSKAWVSQRKPPSFYSEPAEQTHSSRRKGSNVA